MIGGKGKLEITEMETVEDEKKGMKEKELNQRERESETRSRMN